MEKLIGFSILYKIMNYKYIFYCLLFFIVGVSKCFAQNLNKELNSNKDYIIGKLENGLTYYIYHNENPKGKVNFYFLQNAGAILEEDNEDGLAHFLEHMAFNGLEHFPGNTMISYLENNGVSFGSDINAYTAQDETVYNLNNVPNRNGLIDSCLLILSDWSCGISFTEEEIDKERGVITEEHRMRMNARGRVGKKTSPVIYNNSKYSKRNVIGSLKVIQGFKPHEIKEFYNKWYRPDLQAIVVIGDIDKKQIEEKIKHKFASIPLAKNAAVRTIYSIDDHDETKYCTASDKELNANIFQIIVRHKENNEDKATYKDILESIKLLLLNNMLTNRIAKIKRTQNMPFLDAWISQSSYIRNYSKFSIGVVPKQNRDLESLRSILEISQEIQEKGFRLDELVSARTQLVLAFNEMNTQKHLTDNHAYFEEVKEHFLNGNPILKFDELFKFFNKNINKINLSDINKLYKELNITKNRVVSLTGPDSLKFPPISDIKSVVDDTKFNISAKQESEKTKKMLFNESLKPVQIIKTEKISKLAAEIFTLSNGAKVAYKYCNLEPGKIVVIARSNGGYEKLPVEYMPNIGMFSSSVSNFGLGNNSSNDLKDILLSTSVRFSPKINKYSELIEGTSNIKDFEKLMQVIYMSFEQALFDKVAFEKYKSDVIHGFKTNKRPPFQSFIDSLKATVYKGNPRLSFSNLENFEALDFETTKKIYQDRFNSADDFLFLVVGDIGKSKLKKMISKYIGNIKSSGRKESIGNMGHFFPKGKTKACMDLQLQKASASTIVKYNSKIEYSQKNYIAMNLMLESINNTMVSEIREKEGGSYSVNVNGSMTRIPESYLEMTVSFDCDPARLEYLKQKADKIIANIIQNGIDESAYKKAYSKMKKLASNRKKNNMYWVKALSYYIRFDENINAKSYSDELLDNMTYDYVNHKTKEFLNKADIVDFSYKSK
ncbi:MAG: insulinase family protein [Marinifilaceae bacterium]|jgi:zinc protease|nr:insulinase family protein [Marinifilaceae bacterium]